MINTFLAQLSAPTVSSNVSTSTVGISKIVAEQFNQGWENLLNGGLYNTINKAMLGLALLFFVISAVTILIEWIKSDDDRQFYRLITPIFVVIFLMNDGVMTKTLVMGIRDISNMINNKILVQLELQRGINKRFEQLTGDQKYLTDLRANMDKCINDPKADTQAVCLNQIRSQISDGIINKNIRNKNVIDRLEAWNNEMANKISQSNTSGIAIQIGDALIAPINLIAKIILSPLESAVFFILMLITSGVQIMAEGSMMLTSLLAPIYITGALLPSGMKSIITLLTSFWTIVNWKICYTIIVGLTSSLLSDDEVNSILLALISGILAPILAGILAKGGGMGFAQAASSAAGKAIDLAGQAVAGAATGGTSTVAMSIGKSVAGKMK